MSSFLTITVQEMNQIFELIDIEPLDFSYTQNLTEAEIKQNLEELIAPYKHFLRGLWDKRQHPTNRGNGERCPRCGIRPRTDHGYCSECYQEKARESYAKAKAKREEEDRKNGIVRRKREKFQVTEKSNLTFFSENLETIQENAKNWAYHIAKYTHDYDSVPDYQQEILLFIWKESLYYDPSYGCSPKSFIINKARSANSAIFAKMNTKRRQFWQFQVKKLEDMKLTCPQLDFVDEKTKDLR